MSITSEEISAFHVSYGQWIKVEAVSHLEVTLVIGTPDIVGFFCYRLGSSGMFLLSLLLLPCISPFLFRRS